MTDKRWQGTTHPLQDLKSTRETKRMNKREERMGHVARGKIRTHEETELDEASWDLGKMPHDKLKSFANVPHPRFTKNEIDSEIKRRKRTGEYHSGYQTEETELDETLNIQQRQKRAAIMRRYKSKIERGREISQKRVAGEGNIKKRAYAQARQIFRKKLAGDHGAEYEKLGPSEKIAIDKMLDNKGKAIKKLALRLVPKVKKAEYERLQSYMKGQSMVNHGAAEGKISEEFNELFLEYFGASAPGNTGSTGERSMNPIAADKTNAKSKGKSEIKILGSFTKEEQENSSIYKALEKKSLNADIPIEVLGEVYDRGLNAWTESYKVSPTQYAFARVNSFINKGKSYYTEDADLQTGLLSFTEASYRDSGYQNMLKASMKADPVKHKEDERRREQRNSYMKTAVKKISAKYAAEETIDELSKSTLKSYIDKTNDPKEFTGSLQKFMSRGKGYRSAKNKLKGTANVPATNEETELDESNNTPYVKPHIEKGSTKQSGWKASNKHGKVRYFGMDFKSGADRHAGISEETELDEGIKEKIKGVIRREKAKELPLLQTRRDYAHGKAGDAYAKGDTKTGDRYINWREKSLKQAGLPGSRVKEDLDEGENTQMKGKDPCWKGYEMVGKKKKGGKEVPNCVPVKEESDLDEGAIKDAEKALSDHDKYRADYEKKYGQMSVNDARSHEIARKKLLAKKRDAQRKFHKKFDAFGEETDLDETDISKYNIRIAKPKSNTEPKKTFMSVLDQVDIPAKHLNNARSVWNRTQDVEAVRKFVARVVKEEKDPDANTKARRKLQYVERDATPETTNVDSQGPKNPCSSHGKQQRVKKIIVDEQVGNVQPDPKKRLVGTDSLVKAYKKDTPGQSLDESFAMAFDYQGKPTLAPTAAELHMQAKGGFAHHTDVQNVMEVTEIKNKIQAMFETTILEEDKDQLALSFNELTDMVQEAYGIIEKIKSSTVERDAWSEAQILKMERYIQSVEAYLDNMSEDVVAADKKGEIVRGFTKVDPSTGETVQVPAHVRKAGTGKKIIKSGSPNDGIPG